MTSSPLATNKVLSPKYSRRLRHNPYDLSTESGSSSVNLDIGIGNGDLMVSHESIECGTYTSPCEATPAPHLNVFSPAGPATSPVPVVIQQQGQHEQQQPQHQQHSNKQGQHQCSTQQQYSPYQQMPKQTPGFAAAGVLPDGIMDIHGNNATNFMSNMVSQYLNSLIPQQQNFQVPPHQHQQQGVQPEPYQQQQQQHQQWSVCAGGGANRNEYHRDGGYHAAPKTGPASKPNREKKVRATVQCRFCGEFHNQRLSVHLVQCTKFPGRQIYRAGAQRVCGFCQETLPEGMIWKEHNMICTRPISDPSSAERL